ncbi:tRNA(m5U54)methyltransferase [Ascosphaera aggregata]|nr:tRNA(m5U54)methyltransferase [Ascosphaera aggregata]
MTAFEEKRPPRSRNAKGGQFRKKRKVALKKQGKDGDHDEVLSFDVNALLERSRQDRAEGADADLRVPETVVKIWGSDVFPETEVTITEISSTGDGLALSPAGDHVYVVPFTTAGDVVKIKVVRTMDTYSTTDLLEVIKPSTLRDDSRISCQYFGRCSGCQLQMLKYSDQLVHKRKIIEKAFKNFSGLVPELVPTVGDTIGSPLQYGYRTKLTPHFPKPEKKGEGEVQTKVIPPIGFNYKGRQAVLDIEDCPLGTDIVRLGLKSERKRVIEQLDTYKLGATLLLRESTRRIPKENVGESPIEGESQQSDSNKPLFWDSSWSTKGAVTSDIIRRSTDAYIEEERCVTGQTATSYEYVDNYVFQNKAGQFFQNNNSILTPFTQYIRDNSLPPSNVTDTSTAADPTSATIQKIKYLLDAYSGSGLFTVTLSPLFISSLGIDISAPGIEAARKNAQMNNLPHTGFAAADAADLFKDIPYPADRTLLVIDPPRKGCGTNFLQQMMDYAPARVVYVSCNVHTQARDIGVLVRGEGNDKGVKYEIESIRGFDFFPQTGHVESVAVLNKA